MEYENKDERRIMTREESIHKAYKEHLLTEGNPSNGFEYGARWADAHPKNPWHKASEELPKIIHSNYKGNYSNWCLCIDGEGEYHRLLRHCNGSTSVWAWDTDGRWPFEKIDCTITHWMEIPELPKED